MNNAYIIQSLGTRHNIHHDDYSQMPADFIRNVRVDGKSVDVPMFYTMYDCSTHNSVPLSFSRQPGTATTPKKEESASTSIGDTFSERVYMRAKYDLDRGVREDLGPNDGTQIREYAKNYGLRPPLNWCGVTVGTWIKEAVIKEPAPVQGSPAAQGIIPQLKAANMWVPADKARANKAAIVRGSIVVWKRPPETWTGHIGVVEANLAPFNQFKTIEPNSGPNADKVARMDRNWGDPNLLGFGVFHNNVEPVVNGKDPLS